MNETLQQVLVVLLSIVGICMLVGTLGLVAITRRIRRLGIPREADFFTTMRLVPLSLVVLLDILDFGLDVFSAPLVWMVLDRMGLPNLRNKATIEAFIPLSGPIPTFTLCWVAARLFNLGTPEVLMYLQQFADHRRGDEMRQSSRRQLLDG